MVANKPLLSIQPVAVQFQDAMYAFDQAVHPMLSGLEQHAGQLGHQPEWGKDQADEISMWHSDLYTTSPHEDMLQGCSNWERSHPDSWASNLGLTKMADSSAAKTGE